MADVGFGGMAGPEEDLRTAWRNKLAREGKLNAGRTQRRGSRARPG